MEISKIDEYFTPDIIERFVEIQQPRSRVQLEKFVVEQHDTPEMQYMQCVLEIQNLYYTLKSVAIDLQIAEIEISKLKSSKDPIDQLNAQKKELGLEQTRVVGVGAFRELEILLQILEQYPRYTRKDIEDQQLIYWKKRLERQAMVESISGSQAVASNINSLLQLGELDLNEIEGIKE